MGAVMVAVAVVMIANLDIRFENAIARHLPVRARRPDQQDRAELRASRAGSPTCEAAARRRRRAAPRQAAAGKRLPVYFRAPDFTGTQQWFNTPGGRPLSLSQLRGPGRPGRLLDLHLHQLHPHAALHRGLVPEVPPRRVHRRRGAHARVPVREGRLERPAGDRRLRPHLSGRPGQRLRHLDRLRQPVLAGGLPDRRHREGPARPLRRGLLRRDRAGDPRACSPRPGPAGSERWRTRRPSGPIPTRTPESYLGAARADAVRERPDPPRPTELPTGSDERAQP